MKGCRPLSPDETRALDEVWDGLFATRNRALFVLGVKSGFRISEMLSLRRGDIVQGGRMVERVAVKRRHTKRKLEGRTVLLHPEAAAALRTWLQDLWAWGYQTPDAYLFQSAAAGNRAISRVQAYRIFQAAFQAGGLIGKLGCHSTRKTFADRMYDVLKQDIRKTQVALGHKNLNSTASYLSFREQDIDDAVLKL